MTLLLSFGEELLDCGEDHAAGLPLQQFAEVCPAFGLDRGLADMFAAPCEGVEELAVEVVLVCEDDEVVPSGVFEVEDLREAVAGPPVLPVLDRDAVGQVAVERMVVLDERCGGGCGEFADGLIDGSRREVGVAPAERVADSPGEEGLVIVGALLARFAGGDLRPGEDGVAETGKTSDSVKVYRPHGVSAANSPLFPEIAFLVEDEHELPAALFLF